MLRKRLFLLATVLVATNPAILLAQDSKDRRVEQYECRDIMRDSGVNRDVSVAFLHGYLLGKSGSSAFNLDAVKQQTDAFIEHCLSNPSEKAVDAMTAVKK